MIKKAIRAAGNLSRRDWWGKFFGHDYLRMYEIDRRQSSREANFAARALQLAPGDRVLDLACGAGRHTIELARAGFDARGLDFSPELLKVARALAAQAGVSPEFVKGDMRYLPWAGGVRRCVKPVFQFRLF